MTNNVETALSYLSQIRKVYAERLNIKFQEENFSPNEISVLILLSNNKSINTSSQLTTILGVSKSLVSRSLAALERKGLIQTREASGDRRSREMQQGNIPYCECLCGHETAFRGHKRNKRSGSGRYFRRGNAHDERNHGEDHRQIQSSVSKDS